MSAGWSMLDVQGRRIFELVTVRTRVANHVHFARLFVSQLLHMCRGDTSASGGGGDVKRSTESENVTLLLQLKLHNPARLKRYDVTRVLTIVVSYMHDLLHCLHSQMIVMSDCRRGWWHRHRQRRAGRAQYQASPAPRSSSGE